MADEVVDAPFDPSAAQPPSVLPDLAAPVAAPAAVIESDAPAPEVPAAVAAAAPVVEAPKPDGDILAPPKTTTEAVADPAAPPTDAEPPLPTYEPPALPDGITITDPERFNTQVGEFDARFGDLERKFGIDHDTASAFRSEVMGLAIGEIARITQQAQEALTAAHAAAEAAPAQYLDALRTEWRAQFEKSDLAGNRRDTTLERAEATIREFAGDEAAFRKTLQETGMANNPAMIRLLANVGSAFVEGRPVPASRPSPGSKSKAGKLYGNA